MDVILRDATSFVGSTAYSLPGRRGKPSAENIQKTFQKFSENVSNSLCKIPIHAKDL